MLFTVIRDKVKYMSTNYVECIYDKDTLKHMADAGYKFKLNGKSATVYDIVRYCKENGVGKNNV